MQTYENDQAPRTHVKQHNQKYQVSHDRREQQIGINQKRNAQQTDKHQTFNGRRELKIERIQKRNDDS